MTNFPAYEDNPFLGNLDPKMVGIDDLTESKALQKKKKKKNRIEELNKTGERVDRSLDPRRISVQRIKALACQHWLSSLEPTRRTAMRLSSYIPFFFVVGTLVLASPVVRSSNAYLS